MIKLFRNFRKKMLKENKTQRYFKYAFGEIVLVVIGILIALQINTWNENRKAANEETTILRALEADFKVSKARIVETMKSQKRVLDYSKILIEIHEEQNEKEFEYFDIHLDSLDHLIGYGTSWYRTEPVTGAYNALISAGKVDLIKNEELRNILAQFSADLESGFEDQDNTMKYLQHLVTIHSKFTLKISSKKFRDVLNLSPRKKDTLKVSKKFFSNNSYFSILFEKSILEYNRFNRQKNMLDQTNAILKIINSELKRGKPLKI